jgi:hypothetical protein
MNRGMAVCAAAIEVADGVKQGWSRWVPARDVTGIAHPRHPHLKQLRVAGAVRLMAVNAILHDWWVLPQERATPFGMASQAILVHRGLPKLAWIGRAMRVMAAGASHFAFPVWHVRGALQLRSTHLVTPQAKFRLRFFQAFVFRKRCVEARFMGQWRMKLLMRLVAIHASHGPRFVRAASPEKLVLAGVAL